MKKKIENKKSIEKRKLIFAGVFSLIFALFQVIGYCFSNGKSLKYIFRSKLGFFDIFSNYLTWFLLSLVLVYLIFGFINRFTNREEEYFSFSWKQFLLFVFLYMLCWLPYFLIYYPGVNTGDTTRQIMMYFHLPTRVAGRVCTDGINVIYSAHHPLFLTFVYGLVYQIGAKVGNLQLTLGIFSLLQMFLMSLAFTWSLKKLSSYKISKKVILILFLYTALSPNIAVHTINMYYDLPFSVMSLVLTILVTEIVVTKGSVLDKKLFLLEFFCASLLLCLFKKTGFYILLVLFLLLLIVYWRKFFKLLIVMVLIFVSFNVLFEGVLYNRLNVKESGIQEMLSIPFQQTARYLRDFKGDVSDEEKEAIDKVLKVDVIANSYDPELSDYVKNTYRDTATDSDMKNYFLKGWLPGLKKAPSIYILATLNNTYKYFYVSPNLVEIKHFDIYSVQRFFTFYKNLDKKNNITYDRYEKINIESPAKTENIRIKFAKAIEIINGLPLIGSLLSIGLNFMGVIVVMFYFLYRKKKSYMLTAIVGLLNMAMCVVSPVNGNLRYALPVILIFPFLLALTFKSEE